ncbi:hypothetical protein ACFWA9_30865 [Kitasatospora sp. NPDC059973]|uniref:hypothetical protein n=1 Tax=Kitasatospora sp. NPDC059973 TaxID=3347020 RepID=UPI003688FE39
MRLDAPEPPALIAIQQRTGLADEMWREIAPLLAEEGITEDSDPTDLPTLPAALDRAVARYNAALFTPTGKARGQAAELLRQVVASVAAGETAHAARLLDTLGPDPTDAQPATGAHAAGLATLLLDNWSTGPAGVRPDYSPGLRFRPATGGANAPPPTSWPGRSWNAPASWTSTRSPDSTRPCATPSRCGRPHRCCSSTSAP